MADVQALLQALAGANVASGASASELLQQLQEQAKSLLSTAPAPESGATPPAESSSNQHTNGTGVSSIASGSVEQAQQSTQKVYHGDGDHTIDIAILQASPLVLLAEQSTDAGGNATAAARAVAPLELATERRLIIKSLRESTRALKLVVSPATLDSLQRVWMVSWRVAACLHRALKSLHFTCTAYRRAPACCISAGMAVEMNTAPSTSCLRRPTAPRRC